MRYPASEKLEIIRLVERSHIGVRPTLAKLGIPKTTFYRRYDRYLAFGRGWFYLSTILDDYSLEALHHHEDRGCNGQAEIGVTGIRF